MLDFFKNFFAQSSGKVEVDSCAPSVADFGSAEDFLFFLRTNFSYEVKERQESAFPVTESAFNCLSESDIASIFKAVEVKYGPTTKNEVFEWKDRSYPHYRREVLRYGCACLPEILWERTRMTPANPPDTVHSMMRNPIFAGDLYSGDMVVSALERAGIKLDDNLNYLDFGCSSGALVRNLYAYQPRAKWYGCDPVMESIAWAQSAFPWIDFYTSPTMPNLKYSNETFHGVYAISIWSHFSETAALRWFEEIHRVLKPGGWLVFTTHGFRSVYYYLDRNLLGFEQMYSAYKSMVEEGFYFQPVWSEGGAEIPSIDVMQWGNAYFSLNWVCKNLLNSWKLVAYSPGINQINQDLYVLEKRTVLHGEI